MYYANSLGGTWKEAFKPTHGVLAVSCPSTSFCVDSQEGGRISYSTSPASTSWTELTIGSGAMNGVFCISSAFCAAVNGSGDLYIANTEAHIKEATGWKSTDIDGSTSLHGVSCVSTTSCVAVDGEGNIIQLTIEAGGGATASKLDIDEANDLTAVACTSGSTCAAVDSKGRIFVSTSNGETWNMQHTVGTNLTSVACASLSLCVAADTSGNAVAFTPVGVPTSRTQTASANSLNAISCVPQIADCVVADNKGNEAYSTNVSTTAAATWKSWTDPSTPSEAVACPTSSLCVLANGKAELGEGGNMYYATTLGGAWSEAFSPEYGVVSVSCASSSLCVAGQSEGFVRYTTKPNSTEWFALSIGTGTMKAVDCLSSSFCVAVNSTGHIYVANTEAKIKEETGWTSTDVDGTTALNGVACTAKNSCVAVDGEGQVLDLTISSSGKAEASTEDLDGKNNITGIACTGTDCVIVDNKGNVFVSTTAGATWQNQHTFSTDFTGVSCATNNLCAAIDTKGQVTTFGLE